ncbi:MAG: cytochrome b [Pseudomonadota bacterium]|nr:cytochrome b [Pseudomonadota bacterium]
MAQDRYSRGAIILHWLIALLIIGQLCGGFYMAGLSDEQASLKFQIFQLHKSFGVTILLLSIVRLGWRLTHKVPPLPPGMAAWERVAARATHIALYVMMFVTPLLGWAYVSVAPLNVPTYLFGVIPWPHMPFFEDVADRKAVAEMFHEYHEAAAFVIIGLLALHVAGALKHHFLNRDDVLSRMLPLIRSRS